MKKASHFLLAVSLLAALAIVATGLPIADAGNGNANSAVVPTNAKYGGLSYGQWQALWWKAVFDTPVVDDDHPLFSGDAFGGYKNVVFLSGAFSDPDTPVDREIAIPAGTALFFPIVNVECSVFEDDPFHGDNEAELRACANEHVDHVTDVFATIDGKPVVNLHKFRTQSPLFTWGPLPEDNIFAYFGYDAPAGTTSPAVDAGYYLLVKPLSVGTHVITFGGTFGGVLEGSINTRYVIHVLPKKK